MVMPPRNLWELLVNVKVRRGHSWKPGRRWLAVREGEWRTARSHLPVCSVTPTDGSSDSLSCVPFSCREGPTFPRPTSSRRRWWWQGGWGTWGSSVPSSTGSATAKKPTASDAAASADVSARLGSVRCEITSDWCWGRHHTRASHVAPTWSLAGLKGSVSQREIWCEIADGASERSRRTNATRTKYRLPNKHSRQFQ